MERLRLWRMDYGRNGLNELRKEVYDLLKGRVVLRLITALIDWFLNHTLQNKIQIQNRLLHMRVLCEPQDPSLYQNKTKQTLPRANIYPSTQRTELGRFADSIPFEERDRMGATLRSKKCHDTSYFKHNHIALSAPIPQHSVMGSRIEPMAFFRKYSLLIRPIA